MNNFGKGWPLCFQPLPLSPSSRNGLTQAKQKITLLGPFSFQVWPLLLAWVSCLLHLHLQCTLRPLPMGFLPDPQAGTTPSLWKLHLPWLWGHRSLLVCFCLGSYPLSVTGSSFSARVSVLQGATFSSHPLPSPWAISLMPRASFSPWCSQPVALGISHSDLPPKHLACRISPRGGSICPKEPIFSFSPRIIPLSFSSIWGNDITSSLLAQTGNLRVILRDLFILALLIQAVNKPLFLLIHSCSSPHAIRVSLLRWGPPHLYSCSILYLVSLFSNLISRKCFLYRVIF